MNFSKEERKSAFRFIVALGFVSLFADMTYEGAHSVIGPLLKDLGASATQVGIIAGLGETDGEMRAAITDLRNVGVEVLTVGQYLRPTKQHAEVVRYYRPEEFAHLKSEAVKLGFGHVEAGPLVRSSYHADEQVPARKNLLAG